MNHIDILDNEITINGSVLTFPMSYEEVKSVLGDSRIEKDAKNHNYYIYDELGIYFEEGNVVWLKKQRAYKDAEHRITSVYLHVADELSDADIRPAQHYVGNVTFFGKQKEHDILNRFMGCYQECIRTADGELELAHVGAYVGGKDDEPNYAGDRFLKSLDIAYKPRKPKTTQNYAIQNTDEEALSFDTFNFKLSVINELMYEQEILKPYFDIYEYMDFKKAHWNLETEKNVRGALQFFKDLPIPVAYADKVTVICMDGGNEIYQNIAPLWDGEDERFDIDKLTEAELRQFPNLKSMTVMTTKQEKLQKICEKCGIEVSAL